MKLIITVAIVTLLTACAAAPQNTVTAPEGGRWVQDSDGIWTDQLGRTSNREPRIPLCSEVTLKKDTRECVIRR